MNPESLRASIAYHPCLYEVLREVCSNLRPVSYLEIGVKEGDSLLTVLEASEGSVRKLTLCDIWKGEGGYGHLSHEHIELLLRELNYDGDGDRAKEVLDGTTTVSRRCEKVEAFKSPVQPALSPFTEKPFAPMASPAAL